MKYCLICLCELQDHQTLQQWLFMEDPLCKECRAQFCPVNRKVQIIGLNIFAFYLYDSFMEALLFQMKEGRDIALAPLFFLPFSRWFHQHRHLKWILMPSSEHKFIERGFSPLREMLKNIPGLLYEPLYKKTDFKQSKRSKVERAQVSQEIFLKEEYPIPQGHLLLIDDVCTTGATLQRAYQLLKTHNNEIEAVVLCIHPLLLEQNKKRSR